MFDHRLSLKIKTKQNVKQGGSSKCSSVGSVFVWPVQDLGGLISSSTVCVHMCALIGF